MIVSDAAFETGTGSVFATLAFPTPTLICR